LPLRAAICLYRVESKHPIRYTIREGDALPLLVGSGGRVLAAAAARLWRGRLDIG